MKQSNSLDLLAVKAMLDEFRKNCAPKSRVPSEFRNAVLDLIDCGISDTKVCKTAGLASGQVQMWRKSAGRQQQAVIPATQVLTVVPALATEQSCPRGLRVSYESSRLVVELSL